MSSLSLETPKDSHPHLTAPRHRSTAHFLGRLAPWQIVTALALLLYVPWLGERSLWYPDEPDVAEPAITMLHTGDWVVPRHNDDPWLDYPPLTYWIGAASSRLAASWSPFSLRLPVALLATLLAGLTAWATARVAGKRAGLWAGLSLATAPHFAYQAVHYHPDMGFAAFIAVGIAAYAWGAVQPDSPASILARVGGFACFGGAMLAKGPLGLLLPGLILVIWHASARQWKALVFLAPLSLAAFTVAMPWYIQLVGSLGWEDVWRELYLQNFARFGAADRGHEQPWWYYIWHLGFDWAPWSFVLPAAVATTFRDKWRQPAFRLALIWLVTGLIFFSGAVTKREVYLLPLYPAIAFLLGSYLDGALLEHPRPQLGWFLRGIGGVCIAVTVLILGMALYSSMPGEGAARPELLLVSELAFPLVMLCAVFGIGGIALLRTAHRGVSTRSLTSVALGLGLVYTITLGAILPSIDTKKSYGAATASLRAAAGKEPLGFYPHGIESKRAGFRVEDPAYMPLRLLNTPGEVATHLARSSGIVVLHPQRADDISPSVPNWDHRPQREVQLGSRRFLVIGPGVEGSEP